MDIKQLQFFVKVAETENMTKAAKFFDVSQSAVTQSIKSLENELGIELFYRLNRKISISDGGKVFLQRAKNIIKEYEISLDELKAYRKDTGVVTVATMSGAVIATLKNHIEPMIKPTEIQCFRMSERDSIDQVKNKLADIAISSKKINDVDIVNTPFYRETLAMVISKKDPLAKKDYISLKDLDNRKIVICRSDGIIGAASQSLIFEIMKEQINTDLSMVASIDDFRKDMNEGSDLYIITMSDKQSLTIKEDRVVVPVEDESIAVDYYINYRYEYETKLLPLIKAIKDYYGKK